MNSLNQQISRFLQPHCIELGRKFEAALTKEEIQRVVEKGDEEKWLGYFTLGGKAVNIGRIAETLAALYASRAIRIIEVSAAEAELYANTDLHHVDAKDWHQSWPLVLVWAPSVSQRLFGVLEHPKPLAKVNIVAHGTIEGEPVIDHMYVSNNFEAALANADYESFGCTEVLPGITQNEMRVVVNAVLHLQNYPELFGHHPAKNHTQKIRVPWSSRLPPKRTELIPQIIKLSAGWLASDQGEQQEPNEDEERRNATGTGRHKSPHWRIGHWRRLPRCSDAVLLARGGKTHTWVRPAKVNFRFGGEGAPAMSVYQD